MTAGDPFPISTQDFRAVYASNHLPHAWMIRGPRTPQVARWCWDQATYLLKTDSLDRLMSGAHPHLKYISKTSASLISVSDVRSIGSFVSHTADIVGHRLVIIDSLNDMTLEAQNALLKKLEEPKGATIYFLLAYYGTNVLPTLRSRCRVTHLTAPYSDTIPSELRQLYQDTLMGLKTTPSNYESLFKLTNLCAKNESSFSCIIDQIIQTTAHLMKDSLQLSHTHLYADRIFHLVNMEKYMHVDRRHMLLSAFFNLERINNIL